MTLHDPFYFYLGLAIFILYAASGFLFEYFVILKRTTSFGLIRVNGFLDYLIVRIGYPLVIVFATIVGIIGIISFLYGMLGFPSPR